MPTYVVDVNNAAAPTEAQGALQGAEEIRALKLKLQQIVAGALIVSAAGANSADVVTYIQPDPADRLSMVAGGWLPWNLNQQWGGAGCMPFHLIDSATGTEFKFDAFDGYIEDDSSHTVGDAVGSFYQYQCINPAKNLSLQAVWVKVFKTANPIDNLTLKLWSVAAGIPNALIATANVINGKQITSDSNGQWYRFSFAAVQALVGGTQYIVTLEKSGGVDAVNFYRLKGKAAATKFPNNLSGTGTAVPAWTPTNTTSRNFLVEAQASDQTVQSAGQFTGRIVGSGTGNPVNRSTGFCKPLKEFFPLFHPNGWSIHLRGKSWTKDRTIFEAMYGLHHDRINVRCNAATGFICVTLYEADGTVNTVTGTSDVSTAAFKDILIVGRSMGDGGDYLKIYTGVAGVWIKEGEALAQDYDLDPLFLKQGTAWIMGGFQLFQVADYTTGLLTMAALPSAAGYTFTTTTATVEANVFAISGGKLNQIKAGMAAGGNGNYVKAALGLVNATGASSIAKARVVSGSNTKNEVGAVLQHGDGTRLWNISLNEYFIDPSDQAGWWNYQVQKDFKSNDNVFIQTGKGNDGLVFINGALAVDGTGKNTAASALNQVVIGDQSATANENADVVWDYLGYVNTPILPQFTAGELHEFAVYSGDKNLLGSALYNLGVPLSIKQYCGLQRTFVGESIKQKLVLNGISSSPTTTSAVFPPTVLLPDLEGFVIGNVVSSSRFRAAMANNVDQSSISLGVAVDGTCEDRDAEVSTVSGANGQVNPATDRYKYTNFGLHKLDVKYGAPAGTTTANNQRRSIVFEGEVL